MKSIVCSSRYYRGMMIYFEFWNSFFYNNFNLLMFTWILWYDTMTCLTWAKHWPDVDDWWAFSFTSKHYFSVSTHVSDKCKREFFFVCSDKIKVWVKYRYRSYLLIYDFLNKSYWSICKSAIWYSVIICT